MGKALNAINALPRVRESLKISQVEKGLALLETGEAINLNAGSYNVAGLPAAAANAGRLVYCSNGASGAPCLAYSNGTNWLRILIGAAVSAT